MCFFLIHKKRKDKKNFFCFISLSNSQCCPGLTMLSNDLKKNREHFIDECLCNKLHLYKLTLKCRHTNTSARYTHTHTNEHSIAGVSLCCELNSCTILFGQLHYFFPFIEYMFQFHALIPAFSFKSFRLPRLHSCNNYSAEVILLRNLIFDFN